MTEREENDTRRERIDSALSSSPSRADQAGLPIESDADLDAIDFGSATDASGLVPVIAQHAATGEVLMLAYADREAMRRTLADRVMWFFSRSRNEYWRKGDTSGNVLRLVSLHADCDRDTVLALVLPDGPACHTGARSCFGVAPVLLSLSDVITQRAASLAMSPDDVSERATPLAAGTARASSYTQKLLSDRNLRLKKLGEEAVELAVACAQDDPERAAREAADLWYHVLVACRAVGVGLDDVLAVLSERARDR